MTAGVLDPGRQRLEFGKAAARMGREPAVEVLLVGKRHLNLHRLIKARESIGGAQDPLPGTCSRPSEAQKRTESGLAHQRYEDKRPGKFLPVQRAGMPRLDPQTG